MLQTPEISARLMGIFEKIYPTKKISSLLTSLYCFPNFCLPLLRNWLVTMERKKVLTLVWNISMVTVSLFWYRVNALLVGYVSMHTRFKSRIFESLTYVSITFPLVDVQSLKSIVKPRYILQPRQPFWYRPETKRERLYRGNRGQ